MATSLIDYIFRELAISYLGRNDLAHVQPADVLPDTVGKGAAESNLPGDGSKSDVAAVVQKVASTGFIRKKLTVVHGGQAVQAAATQPAVVARSGAGNVAVGHDVAVEIETVKRVDVRLEQIKAARMKGYEGDSCGECGNFTLVRNGTCLKCETCGSTSGCS